MQLALLLSFVYIVRHLSALKLNITRWLAVLVESDRPEDFTLYFRQFEQVAVLQKSASGEDLQAEVDYRFLYVEPAA